MKSNALLPMMFSMFLRGTLTVLVIALASVVVALAGGAQGRVLAFVSDREGRRAIYLLDVGRGSTIRVTRGQKPVCCLSWSPDGRWLAYMDVNPESEDGLAMGDLLVVDANGRNRHALNASAMPQSLSWSPDGRQLVFTTYATGVPVYHVVREDVRLATVSLDSNTGVVIGETVGEYPAWSPDGRRFVFEAWQDSFRHLFAVDVDGGNLRPLTVGFRQDVMPSWSPDGLRVVFTSFRSGQKAAIYTLGLSCLDSADGCKGMEQRLTDLATSNTTPVWSSDGSEIAFVSDRDHFWDIYLMNADGGNQRRLTYDHAQVYSLAWQP